MIFLRLRRGILLVGLILLGAPAARPAGDSAPAVAEDEAFREQILPLLNRYCVKCHGQTKPKGGVNFTTYPDASAVRRDRKTWAKVLENVESGLMPPEGDMPSEEEAARLTGWVQAVFSKADCDLAEPGRVTIRRLNRTEYNNTIRDLLGVDFQPANDFPLDDVGYGFDNIGDVLTLPPLLMEKYLSAAEQIAEKAIVVPRPWPGSIRAWSAQQLEGGNLHQGTARSLASRGEVVASFDAPRDAEYTVRIQAYGQQAGPEPARMGLLVDGKEIRVFDVPQVETEPGAFEAVVPLKAGPHRLAFAFLNDYYQPDAKDPKLRGDRNLYVVSAEVQGPSGPPLWPVGTFEARSLQGGNLGGSVRTLSSTGTVSAEVEFPVDGEYHVLARAFGQQAGPEPVKMAVRIDGKDIQVLEVKAVEAEPGDYEVIVPVLKGKRTVGLAFLNDYYQPDAKDPKLRGDRNLYVERLEVFGPAPSKLPESHRRILVRTPKNDGEWRDAAREILERFASKAYRRPARSEEIGRMLGLVEMAHKDGEPFERAIQLAVTAILVNPNFLYRVELDRRWGLETEKQPPVRPLNDFELASRLSYFLWSSMPDDELFDLARQKKLQDDPVLEAQARRMLKDPKARALVENFAGQWLTLRNLKTANPDPERFPGFDDALRSAMQTETELCFEAILREDRSVLEFLDADYTFLNERLAKHYGIKDVKGDQFRRVSLPKDSPRGGVLTQASVLTVTSNPTRTSPVKRGKWILEQILGTPPPPPPPNVPELKEEAVLTGTLRERMEQHRTNPSCASCHAKMDPLGFGFENFDAVGAWRDKDGNFPIDPSGNLPSGESFRGSEDLKALLKGRSAQFTHSLSEKLLTYALGRGLEYYDACAVDTIAQRVAEDGYRFSRLVVEIVKSEPFRKRKREERDVR